MKIFMLKTSNTAMFYVSLKVDGNEKRGGSGRIQ
jgi:hypothetical protein